MDKIKILVIDDEQGVLKTISDICRYYDVTIETSSLKAAEVFKNKRFDIFIVAFLLPSLNGIELLKKIREEYPDENYISIFCIDSGTIHLFKDELCDGLFSYFIEKPIDIYDFKEILKKSILKLGKIRSGMADQVYIK